TAWSRQLDGISKSLEVWRPAGGEARLYYSALEADPDSDHGHDEFRLHVLDADGNELEWGGKLATQSHSYAHTTGRFRAMDDGRLFLLHNNLVFEVSEDDGISDFITLNDNMGIIGMETNGDMLISPEG